MPAYNAALTIRVAIDSVLSQSYVNWELIVIDDFSQDETCKVVKEYNLFDSRIKLVKLDSNSGSPALPRNIGLENAKGEYIAFLDADDLWLPRKLKSQVAFIQKKKALIVCSGYEVIDAKGNTIGSFMPPQKNNYEGLMKHNTIGCLTAFLRKDVFVETKFPICGHEDYALWLKVLQRTDFVYGMQEVLARYRKLDASVSSSKFKMIKFFWNIYRNEEKKTFLTAIFYCCRYFWNVKTKYS